MKLIEFTAAFPAVITIAIFSSTLLLEGCMEGKAVGRTAIDATLAICAAEHPDAESPEELKQFCGFADNLLPIVRDLLAAQRKGAQRMAAKHYEFDGGVCLPSDAGVDGSRK